MYTFTLKTDLELPLLYYGSTQILGLKVMDINGHPVESQHSMRNPSDRTSDLEQLGYLAEPLSSWAGLRLHFSPKNRI